MATISKKPLLIGIFAMLMLIAILVTNQSRHQVSVVKDSPQRPLETFPSPVPSKTSFPKTEFINQRFSWLKHHWKISSNTIAIPTDAHREFLAYELVTSKDSLNDPRGMPVVFFPERNRMGVISGILSVRLKNPENQSLITQQHQLKMKAFYQNLSTMLIQTDRFDELIRTHSELQEDDRIQKIEVEIVENNLEKQ